jgi:putative two-component system response regulator
LDNIKPDSTPYDILLIEDDLATIRLITSYFESKDFVCKGVVSGSKGLEELRRTVPKVILLDIILPDISGYDICQTIKTDNTFKKIPVFFLTAISASEVKKHLKSSQADGVILKPFNFSDFDIIFKILNGKAN